MWRGVRILLRGLSRGVVHHQGVGKQPVTSGTRIHRAGRRGGGDDNHRVTDRSCVAARVTESGLTVASGVYGQSLPKIVNHCEVPNCLSSAPLPCRFVCPHQRTLHAPHSCPAQLSCTHHKRLAVDTSSPQGVSHPMQSDCPTAHFLPAVDTPILLPILLHFYFGFSLHLRFGTGLKNVRVLLKPPGQRGGGRGRQHAPLSPGPSA